MKIFGTFLWLCGIFCLVSGSVYLVQHGGFMHWLAGATSIMGTVLIALTTRGGIC